MHSRARQLINAFGDNDERQRYRQNKKQQNEKQRGA